VNQMAKPVKFTKRQLQQLRRLGVVGEQIAEVEKVLSICRFLLRRMPTMGDVRDELLDLQKDLRAASESLKRWEQLREREAKADGRTVAPALDEAYSRVEKESFEIRGDGLVLERALLVLTPALASISRALTALPKAQRRDVHTWEPIAYIAKALSLGWARSERALRQVAVTSAGRAPRPYPHKPSSGESSRFRQIVGICYEAMQVEQHGDPERPIRAYLAWSRARGRVRDLGQ